MAIEFYPEGQYDDDEEENIATNENWKNVAIDISSIKAKKISEVPNFSYPDVDRFLKTVDGNDVYANSYAELDFIAHKFQEINDTRPNVYRFDQFNMDKFITTLISTRNLPFNCYIKNIYQDAGIARINNILICFESELLLYIDGPDKGAIFYNRKSEHDNLSSLHNLLSILKPYRRSKVSKNKIYIVYRSMHGFDKIGFKVNKLNVNLAENYNDDFTDISKKIIDGLNAKDKTNLVILSGEPGTGKTTFIRYLTSHLKKNIIFISPDMVDSITDPAFIPFLMKNNDSILIIEDAEPALEKRGNGGRSSAVSNVLNLTDGLLSDCLKISIVATFNTGTKNIDEALTRKGRLLMNYKFDKLNVEKSKKLLESLGHKDIKVDGPMTLADIYFYGTDNNSKTSQTCKIGFEHGK